MPRDYGPVFPLTTRFLLPAAKIAQLDRIDELIHGQLELIEQKLAGLEEMRAALQAKLERHKHIREELFNSSK